MEPSQSERPLPLPYRLGIFAIIVSVWLVAYFAIPHLTPWTPRFTLPWDPARLVPFLPWVAPLYVSAYLLPAALPFLPLSKRLYAGTAIAFTVMILIAGSCFVLLPIHLPRPPLDPDAFGAAILQWVWNADGPSNCLPSLHVALSFLSASVIVRIYPKLSIPLLVWAALIAASTLTLRQHYVADVLAGLLLAWFCDHTFVARSAQPVRTR